MASGEAEPLQYTTTALRVSIHCEGCRKKVKKVLHSIEGVYKVTVDAAQHKVTVTGSVEAGALVRRLHKAGKQAAPWPSPAPAPAHVEAKEAAPAAPPAAPGEGGAKEAADAKPKDKPAEADGKEKKPAKDKGSGKSAGTGEAADAKPGKDEASNAAAEVIAAPKETDKGSPEPEPEAAKPDAAEEPSGGEGKKKGKKNKKNKPKDGGEGEAPPPAAAPGKKAPQQPSVVPAPSPSPSRPHGGGAFPCYAAQPVLSYNVAHPSSSVSYCAPTAAVPMHPVPPPPLMVPYWYPPYPAMVPVPAELVYGPPGVHESYNNMFNEDNANSCSLM